MAEPQHMDKRELQMIKATREPQAYATMLGAYGKESGYSTRETGAIDSAMKVDMHVKNVKCQMYVYSGHALSYIKLVHRHATETEGNKYFK